MKLSKVSLQSWLPVFIIVIFSLTIYLRTLSRSVYFGDSGEFITVAKTLGIAHPPGYPLYTLLAHLFTYLPFGNLPFKVNLFSAITSSLTLVIVYFISLKLTRNRLVSIGTSLFLAFSYLFWLYSLVAEVFSLNNLFVALIILIALYLLENPANKKFFYLLAFVFGLALTNHHAIILLAPALFFLVLATNPKIFLQPKTLLAATFFFLLGLLPYLYLPIRASQNPALIWGDQTTLGGFFHHVLRRDYGTFSFGAGTPKPFNWDVLTFYLTSLFGNFAGIGIIFAFLGSLTAFRNRRLFLFLFLAFFFLGPLFVFLTRLPLGGNIDAKGALERFFLTSEIIFAIWIGLGFSLTFYYLTKLFKPLTLITIFLFTVPLVINYSKVNQSQNFIYEEFGRKTFEILPQNSIVFVFGDRLSMISKYLQIAKGERSNLKIINLTMLTDNWYKRKLKQLYPDFSFPYDKFQYLKLSEVEAGEIICQQLISKYPTFIENRTKGFDPKNNQYCTNRLYKNLWKLEPPDYKTNPAYLITEYQNFWQHQTSQLSSKKPVDFRTRAIFLYAYSQPLTYLGVFLDEDFGQKEKAHQVYQDAYSISKDNAIALYLTARKYFAEKDFETVTKIEKHSLQIDPTQPEPYKILGFLSLEWRNDKKAALSYFRKYSKLAGSSPEKRAILQLMKELEESLD